MAFRESNWPSSKCSETVSLVRVILSPFCNFLKSLIISSSTFFVLVVGCWRPPCVPSKVSLHLVLTCAQSVRLISILRKKSLFKGKKSRRPGSRLKTTDYHNCDTSASLILYQLFMHTSNA